LESRQAVQKVFLNVYRILGGPNACSLRLDQLLSLLAELLELERPLAWLCAQGSLSGPLDRLLKLSPAPPAEVLFEQVTRHTAGADPQRRDQLLALLKDLMGVRSPASPLNPPTLRRGYPVAQPPAPVSSTVLKAGTEKPKRSGETGAKSTQDEVSQSDLVAEFLHSECERMPLRELLAIRAEIPRIINRRFKTKAALVFTDMVDSTAYYSRFGDEAGQTLMQTQLHLLRTVLRRSGGFLVHQTGDGAFCYFSGIAEATQAMIELARLVARENKELPNEERLRLRIGIHLGEVLRDGDLVTGDAVNVASRITTLATGGQIAITMGAYSQLPSHLRLPCRHLPPTHLKGLVEAVEVLILEWEDPISFPKRVLVLETGVEHELPDLEVISFGRMPKSDRVRGNNIVLSHPDPTENNRISRWQFTLHRHPTGFRLCALSEKSTLVNGIPVERGAEVPIYVGCVVQISGIMNLQFLGDPAASLVDFDAGATAKFYLPQVDRKRRPDS
jgi:class 3 adenylate cyclase